MALLLLLLPQLHGQQLRTFIVNGKARIVGAHISSTGFCYQSFITKIAHYLDSSGLDSYQPWQRVVHLAEQQATKVAKITCEM